MTGRKLWFRSAWFVVMAQVLGMLEMLSGLALILLKRDKAQGYTLLGVGAATVGSMPWFRRF